MTTHTSPAGAAQLHDRMNPATPGAVPSLVPEQSDVSAAPVCGWTDRRGIVCLLLPTVSHASHSPCFERNSDNGFCLTLDCHPFTPAVVGVTLTFDEYEDAWLLVVRAARREASSLRDIPSDIYQRATSAVNDAIQKTVDLRRDQVNQKQYTELVAAHLERFVGVAVKRTEE